MRGYWLFRNLEPVFTGKKRDMSAKALIFSALFSLLASLLAIVSAPVSAQAFSNAGAFNFGTSQVIIEDLAICTNFKYNFEVGAVSEWAVTKKYETCASQSLTTDSLPATLQFKLRIQAIVPDEFQASYVDAFISDSNGNRIVTPRWNPTPLFDLDGPFNVNNGIFYGAFSIPNSNLFPAGKYSLTIQFWNGHWVKLNGPNIPETPKSFVPFAFAISQGKGVTGGTGAGSTSGDCSVDLTSIESGAEKSRNAIATVNAKNLAITDLGAPGIYELLMGYQDTVNAEVGLLQNWNAEVTTLWKNNLSCNRYLTVADLLASYITESGNARSNLAANLAKAKAASSSDTAKNCANQSLTAKNSIVKSNDYFLSLQNKLQGVGNPGDPATLLLLKGWNASLTTELDNVRTWAEKLSQYAQLDPNCDEYPSYASEAKAAFARGSVVKTQVDALIAQGAKASASTNSKEESGSKESAPVNEELAESDGEEEEPSGSIAVTFNRASSRYLLRVESNMVGETLSVRATKRGAKALRFTIPINDDGKGGIQTRTRLAGYTLTLFFGKEQLDRVTVR